MANTRQTKKNGGRLNTAALLRVIGMAVLAVILVLAAAFVIGDKIPSSKSSSDSLQTSGFDIGAASVNSVLPYPGGVAAVADSAVYYFNSSGSLLSKNEHTFASPVASASGRNLILYDLGGYKLRVEKRGGIYTEIETKSVITCAAVGKRGNYAYSLNSDGGYQSHLLVYSGRNKKVFEWGSSSDYVSALTLSDNGKYCAVATLSSENAKTISSVKLFSFTAEEPLLSAEFRGSVVYDISFVTSKKLLVYCNDGVYFVNADGGKEQTVAFSSNEIRHSFNSPSGLKAFSVAVYGNENNTRLTVLNKRGKVMFEKTFSETIEAVVCSDKRVSVVFRNRIESFDRNGNSVGMISLKENVVSVTLSSDKLYVLSSGGMYSVSSGARLGIEDETADANAADTTSGDKKEDNVSLPSNSEGESLSESVSAANNTESTVDGNTDRETTSSDVSAESDDNGVG